MGLRGRFIMTKWSGLLSNVKALRRCSHETSFQVFHCCQKSCLRGLSLLLGRNRTPALRGGLRAVWSFRWRTWSVFSSPVVGDKTSPASPVCHCQQYWWGTGKRGVQALWGKDVQLMTKLEWKRSKHGWNVGTVYIPLVISSLKSEQSVVTWGVDAPNLLKVCQLTVCGLLLETWLMISPDNSL